MPASAAPLVVCDHVSVTLSGRPALIDCTFRLDRGQTYLVLGPNGSGKSTLLRLLRGDIWPDADGMGQRLFFPTENTGRPSPLGVRHRLGLVSPERARALKRLGGHLEAAACILAGARDSLYLQGRASAAENRRVVDLLTRLELTHLAETPVAALSNGQLRAVLLARALMREPLALFLDEFLDGLDAEASAIAGRATRAAAATGTALVITSHRPQGLPVDAARAIVLTAGRLVDSGPAKAVLTRYLAAHDSAVAPLPAPISPPAQMPLPEVACPSASLPLVVLENASVILDERVVLDGVTLTVRQGEHLALVGANGSGKTTLLRLIAGLYHPAMGGSVERPGLAAPEGLTDLREIRKRIGMVSFELEAEYEKELTGLELVLSGFAASIGLYDTPTEAALATARRWLDSLGVADLADRRLGALSAGQTRRLFLARAMVAKPRLLLLDEPFAGLDTDSRREALATVSTLARTGVTVLAAVHDTGDIIPEIRIIRRLDHGRLLPAKPA